MTQKPDADASPTEIRLAAIRRIHEEQSEFYTHLGVYIAVNVMLWVIWAVSTGGDLSGAWPIFPTFGWAIGLVAHGIETFNTVRLERALLEEQGLDPYLHSQKAKRKNEDLAFPNEEGEIVYRSDEQR